MDTPLETLNAKTFAQHLHTRFTTRLPNATSVELQLAEVEERESTPKIEAFFLRFRGPHAPRLPQQTFQLEHEKLGTLGIFLTAVASDEGGMWYEAVFQRFRKPPAV